jgi:DNA-binding NarL/FixJ family response regulator
MAATRLMIVDDHPLFRGALNQALSASIAGSEIIEAGSLDDMVAALARSSEVDLILLDLSMPGVAGLAGLVYLRADHPEIPVVIVSASEDTPLMRRAIEFGASGYIPKSLPVDEIRDAVRKVLDGAIWVPRDLELSTTADKETSELVSRLTTLTPQQVRVLMMLGEGLLNKQIAFRLSVSEATIKAHVSAILQKLGVDSRTQAVIAINRIGKADWPKAAS